MRRDLFGGDLPGEVDDPGPFGFVFDDFVPVHLGDHEAGGSGVVEPAPDVEGPVGLGFERQLRRSEEHLVGVGVVAQLDRDHVLMVADRSLAVQS